MVFGVYIPSITFLVAGKIKAEELSVSNAQQAGYIPDANPFLPAVEAQRMMGENYPDLTDVARASLAQMNEISRRAELAGMTFTNTGAATTNASSAQNAANGTNGTNAAPTATPVRPPSSAARIMAAAAGLMPTSEDGTPLVRPLSRQDALQRIEELTRSREETQRNQPDAFASFPTAGPSSSAGSAGAGPSSGAASAGDMSLGYGVPLTQDSLAHEGLQVFTVGHLMPRSGMEDDNGNWSFDPNSLNALVMPTPQGGGGDPPQEGENESQPPLSIADLTSPTPSSRLGANAAGAGGEPTRPMSAQTLRVRRSTYVPGWAVPPRVLLVDDDAVSRKLSSKFLQVFGCTIDVAVDGVGAVNKMNLEKYDLVLMVSCFGAFEDDVFTEFASLLFVGYRHAKIGRCFCDVAYSPVRPHDTYHLYD